MRALLRRNGLTLALLVLFGVSFAGLMLFGWQAQNEDLRAHGQAALSFGAYLVTGEFLSAVFENWESEFLQMWAFVMLTAYLVQHGSPESKNPDEPIPQDADPALSRLDPRAPGPVHRGGLILRLYSHSLGLALLGLFVLSFVLHWLNSARTAADEALRHGQTPPSLLQHLFSAQMWFESFQNWQSEFLSTAVLIVLGIWLRERGSPESKPVAAPHAQTGGS
jgi:hypothetical protein